jgi:hypothetical protein
VTSLGRCASCSSLTRLLIRAASGEESFGAGEAVRFMCRVCSGQHGLNESQIWEGPLQTRGLHAVEIVILHKAMQTVAPQDSYEEPNAIFTTLTPSVHWCGSSVAAIDTMYD